MTAYTAYFNDYGPKRWTSLVVDGPVPEYGPRHRLAYVVALRRAPTTPAEAQALIDAMTQEQLAALHATTHAERHAERLACDAAARARLGSPSPAPLPEWTAEAAR